MSQLILSTFTRTQIFSIQSVSCFSVGASLVSQMVKNLSAMQDTWVWSLGWEDPLEKGTATHSSILAWRMPWTEEPGRLQSMESQRVRHHWVTFTFTWYPALGLLEQSGVGGAHQVAYEILVPWLGIEPRLWQWKCQVLTTGPPVNSLKDYW